MSETNQMTAEEEMKMFGKVICICTHCEEDIREKYDYINVDYATLCRPCWKDVDIISGYVNDDEISEDEE